MPAPPPHLPGTATNCPLCGDISNDPIVLCYPHAKYREEMTMRSQRAKREALIRSAASKLTPEEQAAVGLR